MEGEMTRRWRLVARCWALVAGGSFGAFFSAESAMAQTVSVRLFEIFHPQSLEINCAEKAVFHAANVALKKLEKNYLTIFLPNNSPVIANWIRVNYTASALEIEADNSTYSLKLTDTVNVVSNLEPATVSLKNGSNFLKRAYSGKFKIYILGRELCVVNLIARDDYLAGILAAEMPEGELTALQAQAVVARTFMIKNNSRHASNGHQFCDLTHCQTYKGNESVNAKILNAVTSTKNKFLLFDNHPIDAFYSSTCGGVTADDAKVWANSADHSYLKSIDDSINCVASPHFNWQTSISIKRLHQIWQRHFGEPISSILITKKGNDRRVRELAIIGHSLHLISGEDFRAVTCRELGWNTIKSTAFNLTAEKNDYIFSGRGLGHGLGLCQYGAMALAQKKYSYQKIFGIEIEQGIFRGVNAASRCGKSSVLLDIVGAFLPSINRGFKSGAIKSH